MKHEFKPSDLRIGDVIWYNAPHGEKLPTRIDYEDLRWISENPKDFNEKHEPIELTEDLLIKLGFLYSGEFIENEYEYYKRFFLYNVLDGTSNFEVHFITSKYGGVESKQTVFSIDDNERLSLHESDYLHTLQQVFKLQAGFELYVTNLFNK